MKTAKNAISWKIFLDLFDFTIFFLDFFNFSGLLFRKKLVKSNKSFFFLRENCISGSFNLFPSSKIDFWPFLKLQKMEFGQKNFVKLIYLISRVFLAWTFLNFLVHYGLKWYGKNLWSQKTLLKAIYFHEFFLAWTFLNFLAHCVM